MPQEDEALEELAKRLAEETGITVSEARDIIWLIGTNWGSLVREARLLKSKRQAEQGEGP